LEFIEYLLLHKVKALPALTKADKLSRVERNDALRAAACKVKLLGNSIHYPILHSSVKKTGNEMIWRWVIERINDES
jgi:GTP-binding protein EngB required for normal cell division